MRYLVACLVRLPRKIDHIEICAIHTAHFVGHRLAFVSECIEKFVEHDVRLEDREPPALLRLSMRLLEDPVPAQLGFRYIVGHYGLLRGGKFPTFDLTDLEHTDRTVDGKRPETEREEERERDESTPIVEKCLVGAGGGGDLEILNDLGRAHGMSDRRSHGRWHAGSSGARYRRHSPRHPLEGDLAQKPQSPCERATHRRFWSHPCIVTGTSEQAAGGGGISSVPGAYCLLLSSISFAILNNVSSPPHGPML